MKKFLLIIFILLIFFGALTSKDYSEIEQIDIATVIYIEKSEDTFYVIAETVKEYGEISQQVSGTGKNFEECISDINAKLTKNLSLSHCDVVLINANTNHENFQKVLRYLKDYNKFPLTAKLLFTNDYNNIAINEKNYNLSEYVRNKGVGTPLFLTLKSAYNDKKVKLPLINATEGGYKIINHIEKEVFY